MLEKCSELCRLLSTRAMSWAGKGLCAQRLLPQGWLWAPPSAQCSHLGGPKASSSAPLLQQEDGREGKAAERSGNKQPRISRREAIPQRDEKLLQS